MLFTSSRLAMTVAAGLSLGQGVIGRKITVRNSCGVKIYAAYAGEGGPVTVGGRPAPAGWEITAGGTTDLDVPENWLSGRIWIRSGGDGCVEDVSKCLLGKCKSGDLSCDGKEYGSTGVTLAEFGLNKHAGQDFYDVSMVEGLTVPVTITPSDTSCVTGSCGVELNPLENCDSRLVYPKGQDKIWSCANPCTAGVQFTALFPGQFHFKQSPSCCESSWTDDKCTHDVIPLYDSLKSLCKMGYVYAKDEIFGDPQTAIRTCPASNKPTYIVDFCAGGVNNALIDPPSISEAKTFSPGSGGALNVGGSQAGGVPSSSGSSRPSTSSNRASLSAPNYSISISPKSSGVLPDPSPSLLNSTRSSNSIISVTSNVTGIITSTVKPSGGRNRYTEPAVGVINPPSVRTPSCKRNEKRRFGRAKR